MKKNLSKLILSVMTLTLLFSFFTGCASTNLPEADASVSYVSLSINPLLELVVEDNIVVSVNYANEDAEILLSDVNLIGMTVEEAAELFVNLAVLAGYMDIEGEDNLVTVTVIGEDEEKEDEIKEGLKNTINGYFDNKGIFGRVSVETLEAFGEQAAALGVSMGHMKMILRALDLNPELDINDLKEMPINELVALFNDKIKDNLHHSVREQANAQKTALKLEYAQMFALGEEIEALQYQLQNFEGEEADRLMLQQSVAEKIAQYEQLHTAFEAAMKAINDEAKTQREALKEQQKGQKEAKISENAQKIQQHQNQFETNKDQIKENIENWRNGKESENGNGGGNGKGN